MYFIFGILLLIASLFQIEIDFSKACILIILSILFFGLDLLNDLIKAYNNKHSSNTIKIEENK